MSFIVWDNLSSLNTALKCLQELEIVATDESGSDSDGGSSSSSFSSVSEMGASKVGQQRGLDQVDQGACVMWSGLDPDTVYDPPKSLQVRLQLSVSDLLIVGIKVELLIYFLLKMKINLV